MKAWAGPAGGDAICAAEPARADAEPPLRLVTDGIGPWEAPRWHEGSYGSPASLAAWCAVWADDGTVEEVCAVPGGPSGLGGLPDGRLLVVSVHERGVYRFDGERLEVHAGLGALVPADLDDMAAGPDGTARVTGFGRDAEAKVPGTGRP